MTKDELLKYQLTHDKAGNGWACVQFDPEGDGRFIRIMSATRPDMERQAFLAALSALAVYEISPGKNPQGEFYPPEPKKLDETQLERLKPFRDGLADGSLKVVRTHVLPAGKAKSTALV